MKIASTGAVNLYALNFASKARADMGFYKKRKKPNILYIMTDQQRFDTINALGNSKIYTPNFDRLAKRGVVFSNCYSSCPVCVPARYTIRTGCLPPKTGYFDNEPVLEKDETVTKVDNKTGPYLAATMRKLGYRTFGVGKFHTWPPDEDLGYDVHLHSEELYGSVELKQKDHYAKWIKDNYPKFDFVRALQGERTEMYYMPQTSPLPAEATVENWAAQRTNELINSDDSKPYFGLVSFVGPHPPFAPPAPYNKLYDPD
jgi:arylsulfatase